MKITSLKSILQGGGESLWWGTLQKRTDMRRKRGRGFLILPPQQRRTSSKHVLLSSIYQYSRRPIAKVLNIFKVVLAILIQSTFSSAIKILVKSYIVLTIFIQASFRYSYCTIIIYCSLNCSDWVNLLFILAIKNCSKTLKPIYYMVIAHSYYCNATVSLKC